MSDKGISSKIDRWINLDEVKTKKELGREKAGTYILHCLDNTGRKAKKIKRAQGTDEEGIWTSLSLVDTYPLPNEAISKSCGLS